MAPPGASEPNSATSPPCGSIGALARLDDGAVDRIGRRTREPLAQRLAGHRHAGEVEQRRELAQHRVEAAGGEQVLHVAGADRLEVDQNRRRFRQFVEAA